MLASLLEGLQRGDRRALARLLSLAARGEEVADILASVPQSAKASRVVAVTGSGGVGKSTLAGKLIELLRGKSLSVAVLACDPQSPLSGGALLGDRFRMPAGPDDGVFIRSLAAASGQGAVAGNMEVMVRLLEAYGFDVILIETVGAGQGDVAVHDLADVVVLLLQPETGDDLQWEKAGLLEVADVVAVHKADLPGAEQAEAQVQSALGLSGGRRKVPILRVSSRTGAGIEELWAAVEALPIRHVTGVSGSADLLRLAQKTLSAWLARAEREADPIVTHLLASWRQGLLSPGEVVGALLRLLAERYGTKGH